MNLSQMNHLSMYKRVNDLLTAESEIVTSIPAFKRAADQLGANINTISEVDSGKVVYTEGKAEVKSESKFQLARAVYIISSSLCNYAIENDMADLEKNTDYSESALSRLPEQELLSVSKAIINLTTGKEDALLEQGLTAEEITNANDKIVKYEAAITEAGTGVQKSISATKTLGSLFQDTNELLRKRLDRYVNKMENDKPDFYNRYYAARRIIDFAATHNKSTEPVPSENA